MSHEFVMGEVVWVDPANIHDALPWGLGIVVDVVKEYSDESAYIKISFFGYFAKKPITCSKEWSCHSMRVQKLSPTASCAGETSLT